LQIVLYPHPTLRHKSKPLKRVDAELRSMIAEMFDLMYEAKGVGLAANQVDLPMRFFIANLTANPDEGEELVFINPVVSQARGNEEQDEGCLSLPELYGPVRRPDRVTVQAFSLSGEEIQHDVDGLLARVIQHETDHLDGVLFIDRMSETAAMEIEPALEEFQIDFGSRRNTGSVPDDAVIAARLAELEQRYC